MKKTGQLMVLFMLFLCSMLMAEFQEPILQSKDIALGKVQLQNERLDAPNVEFVTEPVPLIENYYDYFPGSYNRTPMIVLPEYSEEGDALGGVSIGFHAKETPSSNRQIYNAQINPLGELIYLSSISNQDVWEGFPGTTVDRITANTLIAFHKLSENNISNCFLSYKIDDFIPFNWKTPFQIFEDDLNSEFYHPKIVVSKSPMEGFRRIFVLGESSSPNGNLEYSSVLVKSDFDSDTLNSMENLNFELIAIPELTNQNLPIKKDIAVSDDGKVAIVGWYDTTFFMLYSDDFGETFTYYEVNGRFDYPPVHDNEGNPYWEYGELFAYPSGDGGHFNAFFNDNNQIIVISAMGINSQSNYNSGVYLPAYFYPKIYQFEIQNYELNVQIVDIQLEGENPNDGFPVPPWDLNEDGIADNISAEGELIIPLTYPSHYFNGDFQDAFFRESNFKLTYNNNWVVAVWQDCEKVAMNYFEEPGYEDWAEKPEILISVSADYGETWSQPAYLNAKVGDDNFFSELSDMIPAYVYPADKLEVINSTTAKLHLFFMDDYSYGSFAGPTGSGENIGGMQYYTALSVDMPEPIVSAQQSEIPPAMHDLHLSNFPNPFNPSTTIQFEIAKADDVILEIFNIKGQKVKTLINENLRAGKHELVWNGRDSSENPVSSGVYFYRLKSGKYTVTKKMILMK